MSKKIFVSGASGFQGGTIAHQLLNKGYQLSTLKPVNGKEYSFPQNIQAIPGDFDDKNALSAALNKATIAIFTFPLIFDKQKAVTATTNFVEVAKEQGIELVIFNTGFDLPVSETGLVSLDIKVGMKKIFDESGLKVITVVPDVYIDNMTAPWSIPLVTEQGILPYPVANNQKIPWISHFDLANFICSAIEKPELSGKVLPIGGNLLTGEEIASSISQFLGKEISFISVTPDEFEQQLKPSFGEIPAKEISNLYRYVEQNHQQLLAKDYEQTQELLSVRPQPLNEWVQSIKWSN